MKGKIKAVSIFIHNIASRFWIITVLVTYWFNRMSGKDTELLSVLQGLKEEYFRLGLISALVTLISGAGRLIGPKELSEEDEKREIKSFKYIYLLLFAFFAPRIYWWYRLTGPRREFLYLGLACIVVVLLSGAVTIFIFDYLRKIYSKDAKKYERAWVIMWIVFHIILLLVLGVGVYWQYKVAFK